MEPIAIIKRNTRQIRSKLSTPIDVETDIVLPEGVSFKLYNFNLGGAGIAIPVLYDPDLSKEDNIKNNSFFIKAKVGQAIQLTIPAESPFKNEMVIRCEVCYLSTAQKMQDVHFLYYLGLSFAHISNKNFSTIERALIRL